MADSSFDLSARITADASGLVQAGAQAEAAYEGVGRAGKEAAAGARELETASANATKAQDNQARSERELGAANEAAASSTRDSTTETLAQVIARERASKAAIDTAAAEARLASAQSSAERSTAAAALAALKLQQAQETGASTTAAAAAALEAAEARVTTANNEIERSAAAAALAQLRLQQAQERGSQTVSQLDRDLASLRAQLDPAGEAERRLAQAVDLANTALARGVITQEQYEAHLTRLRAAGSEVEGVSNRQAFAVRNLGQQFGDLGTQVALGGGFARAFASQAGQMGYALSEFGGTLGRVGSFLVGPWGIALTTAAVLAAPFIGKLFDGANAAQEQADNLAKAASAADSYGNAQSVLGKIIDLTTGKLKTQNQTLIQTIRLQAQANILAAQADQKKATATLGSASDLSLRERFFALAGSGDPDDAGAGTTKALASSAAALGPLKRTLDEFANVINNPKATTDQLDAALKTTIGNIDTLAARSRLAGRDVIKLKQDVLAAATTRNDQTANQLVLDAIDGKGIDSRLVPYAKAKNPKKPKSTAALDEFGRDADDKIANFVGQFDEAPAVIDKTNAKVRELDDLIEDLGRKKPPGFEGLIAKAEAAKVVVRDGLIREVAKAFEQPKTLAEKAGAAVMQLDAVIADLAKNKPLGFGKLIADARTAQDVIRNGLQKPYEDFVKEQREGLAIGALTLEGRVDEAAALKTIQSLEKTMGPLTLEQKAAILATTQAMRAQARAIDDLRARNAKYLEAIGSIKTIVEDATQAFVRGDLGQLIKSPGKLLDVFQTLSGRKLFDKLFGGLFEELQDQVNGTSVVKDASDKMAVAVDKAAASIVKLGAAAEQAAAGVSGVPNAATDGASGASGEDIIVNGKRDPIASSIGKVVERIADKIGVKDPAALGKTIGKFASKGLEGAATGSAVSGIAKAIGIKLNSTGSQIGGAIGSFVPIPGGAIIGSIAGGLIGNLFEKAKYGTASINSTGGTGSVGVSGNSTDAAGGLAGSVQDGVAKIASALGGIAGNYNLAIGTFKDSYRVNTSATSSSLNYKNFNSSTLSAFDSAEDAVAYAIKVAVSQGAVQGLSTAVQKALQSSTDIDKALSEALGVKALEQSLGGLPATLKGIFDAESAAAKERVRLAQTYGLDIVATEKLNAEARAKLIDDTLKSRIGSLSDFLDNLKFGDLAEGSATDKRNALLDKIKGVQADAEAGKDGAADQLAQLYAQLVQNSRDAFGTAGGEYTSDRSTAQSGVERVIQMETDQVNTAAGTAQATTDAITQNNALTSESNDLLAQLVSGVSALSSTGTTYTAATTLVTARSVALV